MTKLLIFFSLAVIQFACSNNDSGKEGANEQDTSTVTSIQDTTRKSIPSETRQTIGGADIKINYHAPAVRGRTIWGGLVPYDAVWVTGAHSATAVAVDRSFRVGGKNISAGKYALFTIPGKDDWTVILNKNWNQHLADDYSEAEDVVRIKVKPQATEQVTERLKYEIEPAGEQTANIIISWEKIRVPFQMEIIK